MYVKNKKGELVMKKLTIYSLGFVVAFGFFIVSAFAQTDPMETIPVADFLQALLASLGGFKGASALAAAGLVVQLLLKLLKTDLMGKLFLKVDGIWKLVIIMTLTYASGVLSLMLQGVDVGAALIHSTTLASLMVLGNQLYQHFTAKK